MNTAPSEALRPVLFGEVLFDCFPDGARVLGGAPLNVAWHLQAFGLAPLLISAVGQDDAGDAVLAAMANWGMDLAGIQHKAHHATGMVAIRIADGEPQYTIHEDSAWDNIEPGALPPIAGSALLYHGSLALRQGLSRESLLALKSTLQGRRYVDINLRPPYWGRSQQDACYARSDVLKLNADEFRQLSDSTAVTPPAVRRFATDRQLRLLIVTRGAEGVIAFDRDTDELTDIPTTSASLQIVDTVGAGDAFSSVCMLGLCHGWTLQQMLERARDFAAAIVGVRGATVAERAFYKPFIEQWELPNHV